MEEKRFTAELLKKLYEKHGAALAAYGCCCGLDFGSAEDVVQQLFLKLFQGNAFAAREPVAYLYRAVRNASLNEGRNRRRETELPEEEVWFTHATADQAEILSLQSALRELPEEQREAVFLRVWSGMTLQEIAEATGYSGLALSLRAGEIARAAWETMRREKDGQCRTMKKT